MKTGLLGAAVLAVALAGCATRPAVEPRTTTTTSTRLDGSVITTVVKEVMDRDIAYYNQANSAEMISAEGSNITWQITGATRLVFSTPVPPKQLTPRDQAWYAGMFDTLKTVAPWLMMGWIIHDSGGLGSRSSTVNTTNNTY